MIKATVIFLLIISVLPLSAMGQVYDAVDGSGAPFNDTTTTARVILLQHTRQMLSSSSSAQRALRTQLDDLAIRLEVQGIASDMDITPTQLRDIAIQRASDKNVVAVIWMSPNDETQLFFISIRESGLDQFERTVPSNVDEDILIENFAIMCRSTLQALLTAEQVFLPTPDVLSAADAPRQSEPDVEQTARAVAVTPPAPQAATSPGDASAMMVSPPGNRARSGEKLKELSSHPLSWLKMAWVAAYVSRQERLRHGFSPGVDIRLGRWIQLGGAYVFSPVRTVRGDCVTVRMTPHPMMFNGDFRWPIDRLSLGLSVGVTLNAARIETDESGDCPLVEARSAFTHYDVAVFSGGVAEYRLFSRIDMFFKAGVDWFVQQFRFGAPDLNGTRETLHGPLRVQPSIVLGVRIGVL